MKRFVPILFALIIAFLTSLPASAVENPAFSVEINGALDTEKTINGQNTIVINWLINANRGGLALKNIQGLRLAYDNTVLQLTKWDGSDVIADNSVTTTLNNISQSGQIGAYDTFIRVSAATNASGNLGYLSISLGDPVETYTCQQGTAVTLAQVRFAFRLGKSVSDLAANSIRCMNAGELDKTSQSTAILINTDENEVTSYEYLKQNGGVAVGGDTLSTPAITYPNSTVINVGNNELSGDTPNPMETEVPNNPAGQNESVFQMSVSEQPPILEDMYNQNESNNFSDAAGSSESLGQADAASLAESLDFSDTADPNVGAPDMIWLIFVLVGIALLVVLFVVIYRKKLIKPKIELKNTIVQNDEN